MNRGNHKMRSDISSLLNVSADTETDRSDGESGTVISRSNFPLPPLEDMEEALDTSEDVNPPPKRGRKSTEPISSMNVAFTQNSFLPIPPSVSNNSPLPSTNEKVRAKFKAPRHVPKEDAPSKGDDQLHSTAAHKDESPSSSVNTDPVDPDEILARQLQLEEKKSARSSKPHYYSRHRSANQFTDEQIAQRLQEREYHRHSQPLYHPMGLGRGLGAQVLRFLAPHVAPTPRINSVGLNMMLGFMDRDFNDNDYEMLLRLDEGTEHFKGASVDLIDSLPVQELPATEEQQNCCICLCDMQPGTPVRRLPCLHYFHVECIDQWLKVNKICPIDKKSILED